MLLLTCNNKNTLLRGLVTICEMLHGTKQLSIVSTCGGVTFLSPNKKVTKEVGLGGGAECCCSRLRAALPLRTLSRRAFYRVLSLFQFAFARLSYILYLVSYISLTSTFGFTTYHILRGWFLAAYFFAGKNVEWGRFFVHYRGNARTGSVCVDFRRNMD